MHTDAIQIDDGTDTVFQPEEPFMRKTVQPPMSVYPYHDDWTLMEKRYFPRYLARSKE